MSVTAQTPRAREGEGPLKWVLYGATGYTGRLIVEAALAVGLRPRLGGRDARKLEEMGARYGLSWSAGSLGDPQSLAAMLSTASVLVNAAGPFSVSAKPLTAACLRQGVHYLDLGGDVTSLMQHQDRAQAFRQAGLALVPAIGFDVAPTDAAAVDAASRLERPETLSLAMSFRRATMSRGSWESTLSGAGSQREVLRNGRLMDAGVGDRKRLVDFGAGPQRCRTISWADLISAQWSTGVRNVTVVIAEDFATNVLASLIPVLQAPVLRQLTGRLIRRFPDGPDAAERALNEVRIVATVTSADGREATTCLTTPDPYDVTAASVVAAIGAISRLEPRAGLSTPAMAFGADVFLSLPGVTTSRR